MGHGLQADRYDYLWHAATAILIAERISAEDAKTSKELFREARRSFAKWKKLSIVSQSDASS